MMGGRAVIDWDAIKTEYITTTLSYRQLGEKYGLSHQMIAVRGKMEDGLSSADNTGPK